MNKQEVRSRIMEVGIIPAVRVSSAEDALFAAEVVSRGGIPIVEVTVKRKPCMAEAPIARKSLRRWRFC